VATTPGRIRPWRYLSAFLGIVVVLYALVFFTGDGRATPKLGIDLQGGTRVTLQARTETGAEPPREQLLQAQQIIEDRVNGLGVSGAEVVLDGSNLTITVPGQEGDQARDLGQSACAPGRRSRRAGWGRTRAGHSGRAGCSSARRTRARQPCGSSAWGTRAEPRPAAAGRGRPVGACRAWRRPGRLHTATAEPHASAHACAASAPSPGRRIRHACGPGRPAARRRDQPSPRAPPEHRPGCPADGAGQPRLQRA
jgi:hypothetical protein